MKRSTATTELAPLEVDEITLEGRKIRVSNIDLDLDDVALDPANPRIANTVALKRTENVEDLQREIEKILWEDPDVRDLYRQVLLNKGLIERIIVRPNGTVVEGNCRTVVYRRLRSNQRTETLWQRIPARVLPEDIGERDVAVLLGEMHVAGKNTWSAFEKAGHIYRMHRDFALTQDEIAHRLRMSKSKVNQQIRAFQTMKEKFLVQYVGTASVHKFSYFDELYRIPALRKWMDVDATAEDTFVRWVGEDKLTKGMQVRELENIVFKPEALEAMTRGGFAEAKRVLEQDDPAVTSKLFKKMREMAEELSRARIDDISRIRQHDNEAAKRIIQDLQVALDHFVELCGLNNKR